ncbi:MAG: AraC family transcriptional regulator [Planctomycetota bacterium]|jgi:AraC family transcriptional regulator
MRDTEIETAGTRMRQVMNNAPHPFPADERQDVLQLDGFKLVSTRYRPGRVMEPHSHGHSNITLVLAGRIDECLGGCRVDASSTSFVIKPGGTLHSNRFGPSPVFSFMMELDPGREADIGFDRIRDAAWSSAGPACAVLIELFRELQSESSNIEGTVLTGLTEVVERVLHSTKQQREQKLGPTAKRRLNQAVRILHESHTPMSSSKDLARRVGLHPVYLARLFRRGLGQGISEYGRRLAVRRAASQLTDAVSSQADIAAEVGFADQSHMSRAFRRELGLPPGAFKRLVLDTYVVSSVQEIELTAG